MSNSCLRSQTARAATRCVQSDSFVSVDRRVRHPASVLRIWTERHRIGSGSMRHDSPESVKDRGSGKMLSTPHLRLAV
jgi:hypothetical protein